MSTLNSSQLNLMMFYQSCSLSKILNNINKIKIDFFVYSSLTNTPDDGTYNPNPGVNLSYFKIIVFHY